jgi:hypothetical protein
MPFPGKGTTARDLPGDMPVRQIFDAALIKDQTLSELREKQC